ncbi:MAG: glycosyltransferase [Opitutales bacterium]|jgi:glycosyltransferase involved in cell wall biosynthesis
MRILIIQDHFRVGGTERQSLFLARTFRKKGHDSVVLRFRPGGHLSDDRHLKGIRVETLQPFDSGISLWAPGLMRRIQGINPEVILCMGRTANSYAGFIQKALPRTPVVGTLRTGKMIFPLHHWSLGVVRAVITNSNWWKRRLLERGFPESRIHVAHNSLLLDRSSEEHEAIRRDIRARYGLNEGTCVFLNVATFRPGKRHLDLLRIFAQLREQHLGLHWKLWLVGDGREFRRCRRWVAENGLGTRVRLFHFQHDPYPFYAAADVAVSASMEDSLPNFLIEAQGTGLPVVAYDCRGVEETCLPGKTGLILPPGDAGGFLSALLGFLRDPALRRQYGEPAPAFARERFSQLPQAELILEFLQSLVKQDS